MVTRIGPKKPRRNFIREHREKLGLSQEQLASRISDKTGKDQVSRWENHKRAIAPGAQIAIAEALGIDADEIFRPPNMPSVDELLANASPEIRERVIGYAEALLKKSG